MSDNRESYDPVDRFSEHFRQRLKTYPVLPDENCWDEIETRLQKKRSLSPVWLGLSIAASVLVAILVFNHLLIKKDQGIEENSAYHRESPVEQPVAEIENPEEKAFVTDEKDTVAIDKPIIPLHRVLAAAIDKKQISDIVDEVSPEPDVDDEVESIIQETPAITEERQNIKREKEPEEESDGEQRTGPDKPYRTFEHMTAYNIPDKNKQDKGQGWQLSAGLGSIGGFPSLNFSSSHNIYYNDQNSIPKPGNENEGNIGNGNYEDPGGISRERITDVKPSLPFSIGVTVRRKLNRTLGIETGLVYTRLSSDLVIESNRHSYDAVLNLHYLGVPVNLTVDLWEKNRLSLYASGGGMVEKGLRAVYKQKTLYWDDFMKKNRTDRISGLQWSLNGGIGISYNFYREMNLYVEPGISYSFDCNQPVSRRTEDPLSFNLRLGVRYDF